MQEIAQHISPLLTDYKNDVMMHKGLFERVKTVHAQPQDNLTAEEQMLLDKTYKSFVRNGANLDEDQQSALREIDTTLAKLSLKFGEHVLLESNALSIVHRR